MLHPTRNQHYVPQFLLKNFGTKSGTHIWSFDKKAHANNWNAIEERSIKSVASSEYFYDKEIDHEKNSWEYQLGQIENIVAPIISNLVAHSDVNRINQEEKELISLFVALQMLRTKSNLNSIEEFNQTFFDHINSHLKTKLQPNDPDLLWKTQMSEASQYSKFLLEKTWVLLKSQNAFYISDNPVALANYYNPPGIRGTLGLTSEGIEIYLPISDSLILNFLCPRIFSNLSSGSYETPDITIEYCNTLQVNYADRFILSSKNNFDLVKDILKEE